MKNYISTNVYQIESAIKFRKFSALESINSGMLQLFWQIGDYLNFNLDLNTHISIFEKLSLHLEKTFGLYLSKENVLLMQNFAKRCPSSILKDVSYGISWKYIPVLKDVSSEYSWLYYSQIIHLQSLNPQQLSNLIGENLVFKEEVDRIVLNPDDKFSNIHYEEIMDYEAFYNPMRAQQIRRLLEPKRVPAIKLNNVLLKEMIDEIESMIFNFQIEYNHLIHTMANNSFQYIGLQLKNRINNLEQNTSIEDFIKEIANGVKDSLDERTLLACLKFAQEYKDEFVPFTQLIRFEHIKILLNIPSKQSRSYYAQHAFELGLNPQQLLDLIEKNENGTVYSGLATFEKPVTKNKRASSTKKNVEINIETTEIEPKIDLQNHLNCNIFNDADILKHLGIKLEAIN